MSSPAPHELWKQAGGNSERYRELMVEHGHVVPGEPQPLPCGHNVLGPSAQQRIDGMGDDPAWDEAIAKANDGYMDAGNSAGIDTPDAGAGEPANRELDTLREQLIEAAVVVWQHRSDERISASPTEHCAAMIDALLPLIQEHTAKAELRADARARADEHMVVPAEQTAWECARCGGASQTHAEGEPNDECLYEPILIVHQTTDDDRPEPVDPASVRVGDVVEIEADDGSWMVRGKVAGLNAGYGDNATRYPLKMRIPERFNGFNYGNVLWPDTAGATVRVLQRAEPEPAAVEALAKALHATAGDGTHWHKLTDPSGWYDRARVLIRDHDVHVEVPDAE